ncbi:swi5-like zinc finger protein [Mortierella sp. AD010]|nr:swi5-like zinc finger protein [Mortierella sp. AD010]
MSPRSSRRRTDQSSRLSHDQQDISEQQKALEQSIFSFIEELEGHGQNQPQAHDQELKDAGPSEPDNQDVAEPEEEGEPDIDVVEEVSVEMMMSLEPAPTPVLEQSHSNRGSQEDQESFKTKEDAQIEELKAAILELQRQEREIIQSIRGEGTPSEIISRHIKQLHRYNEIKDAGQIILGKCAELDGSTIKKQYEIYGLDLED